MKLLRALGRWLEDRTGLGATIGAQLEHPVPPDATWMYVFGSATLLAFVLQIVTGVCLAAVYAPSANAAYESLQAIDTTVPLGRLLRGLHFFGASAMIALVGMHLVRVYLTGAYKFPRELNWLSGVLLLLLTLALGFTGQLLRWDQNAVWTVVVGAEQAGRTPFVGRLIADLLLGGPTLGADTLTRFFALHAMVLPGLVLATVGLHLHLVLRNGVSEPPRRDRPVVRSTYRAEYERMLRRRGVPFWPDAIWRDAVFGAAVVAAIFLLAWWFGPPKLDLPPDPSLVHAHPRPDWYFLFYFALLALMPHGLENYVIILGPLLVFLVLILVPLLAPTGQRSLARRPWAVGFVVAAVAIVGSLTVAGVHANWSPRFDAGPLPASVVASQDDQVQRGAALFHDRACVQCHTISGHGGKRGPDLTHIGTLRDGNQFIIQILNGGYNMPAFGSILAPDEVDALVAFLQTRR